MFSLGVILYELLAGELPVGSFTRLSVRRPELDGLAGIAEAAGAAGARLTGAGFGGCIIAVADADRENEVHAALRERFYAPRGVADAAPHLFTVPPSAGAEVGPA